MDHATKTLAKVLAAYGDLKRQSAAADDAYDKALADRNRAREACKQAEDQVIEQLKREAGLVTCAGFAYRLLDNKRLIVEPISREIPIQAELDAAA